MNKTCVFAGSFDPVHIGHLDVIGKCNIMFEKVVVAIGVNDEKKYRFPLGKRLEMLKAACARYENVEVTSFDGLLVDFLHKVGTNVYVRGIRDEKDYKYEKSSFDFNVSRYEDIETYFVPCSKEVRGVSSTLIKALLDEGKDVSKYLPYGVKDLIVK